MNPSPEQQYLNGMRTILDKGIPILNERTGDVCHTYINIDMEYDCSTNVAPLVTTRKAPTKLPIAELLGYIRGYTSAAQFRAIGTSSWDANANENKAWLNNPARGEEDDMGLVYGAVARNWPVLDPSYNTVGWQDLFYKVYRNLKEGKDDRGEVITFWNPSLFGVGCLRPCLHSYQFSLVGDDLYLNAFQRSADWPLGTVANMVQVYVFLRLMAQITGKNPKTAFHKNVNCHIYEGQVEGCKEQLTREILSPPRLEINPDIKTLHDLRTWVTLDDFVWEYDEYHPPIKFPFSV